jgi:parvulin-like peptidyl-prolyl isomerase
MSADSPQKPRFRLGWRRLALLAGCVAAVAGAFIWKTATNLPKAEGGHTGSSAYPAPAPRDPNPPNHSDYPSRVVAYVHETEAITRQDLGEYLIARQGAARVETLVNLRIIQQACRAQNVEVTSADVENALAQQVQGVTGSREKFFRDVLKNYHMNMVEWKEDRVRPKLMLSRLCRGRATCTQEDVFKAFESAYGEKIQARIILWKKDKLADAQAVYEKIRDKDEEFAEVARHQFDPKLSSTAGKIKPIARYGFADEAVEKVAFSLRPGQVSELISTRDGIMVIKCDGRLPADTTVSLQAKWPDLERDIIDAKLEVEIPKVFAEMRKQADPKIDWNALKQPGNPEQVIAVIYDTMPITREELGEFLIARLGAESLEMMVNKRIIERACWERSITVSDEEIEASFQGDLKRYNVDATHFEKDILKSHRTTVHGYREDVVRMRLLMDKLVRPNVKATDAELRLAYEAYYGERIECRMILYPQGEEKAAMNEYNRLRDDEKYFDWKAQHQASNKLASAHGRLEPAIGSQVAGIGRHTTGNEELEREIFALQEGDLSRLIGTPEGTVVVKCDKRIAPNTSMKYEQVRNQFVQEVVDKKVVLEVPRMFSELQKQARPRLLLYDPSRPEDLTATVQREMESADPFGPQH